MENSELRKLLKSNLERGAINEIATKANVSRQTVNQVISGKSVNNKVLTLLYKYAKTGIEIKLKLKQLQS